MPGQGVRSADNEANSIRVTTLNVDTKRCSNETKIVEMLTRRRIDICCVQKERWKGESTRTIAR